MTIILTVLILTVLASVAVFTLAALAVWALPLLLIGFFALFAALAFGFLWFVCTLVDYDKPKEEDSKFYRIVMNLYIAALAKVALVRIHKRGLEQLPREGRFVLCCNHLSNADPVLLLEAFPQAQIAFISKKENKDMFIIGPLMHKIMCQMIDRDNDREALKTILKCIQMIKNDQVSVGIFPEGYTSEDGRLQHFRPGVFKIAQKTGVPVVVCTLQNTAAIFDNLPKLKKTDVQLHLVGVISPEDYKGMTTVELSDLAHKMMLDDLGPDFAPILAENT